MTRAHPEIRFFIATHKPWPLPQHPLFQPLTLGGYQAQGAIDDARGDSIAERNPHYSELTAWYWIWKNVTDVEMVGLCHYRRYFLLTGTLDSRTLYLEPTPANLQQLHSRAALEQVKDAYRTHQIIVPRAILLPTPIHQHYLDSHRSEDWECFRQAVREITPEHGKHFDALDDEHRLYPYNMMIAPWTFFADYMARLLAVLDRVDALADYSSDSYQRRAPAFLAERFFTLHLLTVRPELVEVPILTTDPTAF